MSLRYLKTWAALAATLALAPTPARAQFVAAIFISPCQTEIPTFTTGTLHIWVCLEGPIADGITSGEFRVDGLPSGWISSVRPHPAAEVFAGDLFGAGVRIAFPICQPGSGQYLELFAIDITPTDVRTDVLLNVAATIPPSDPGFPCPFVTRCDAPGAKVCVSGFGSYINPRERGCPLAVENLAWGRIKRLYE
jgi:hypothetical protein